MVALGHATGNYYGLGKWQRMYVISLAVFRPAFWARIHATVRFFCPLPCIIGPLLLSVQRLEYSEKAERQAFSQHGPTYGTEVVRLPKVDRLRGNKAGNLSRRHEQR